MRRALLLCVGVLTALAGSARADIFFTQTFVADFEFSFPAGSPLNPNGPDTPYIPFRAVGDLTFGIADALNDPSQPTTVAITSFTGSLNGVSPGQFLPYSIDPNVSFVGGDLTNIVRDAGGRVTSAQVTGLSAYWELLAPGLRLYGDAPLVFDGAVGSIPFAYGDILSGPLPFNVYLDTGQGPAGDPLFALGRNRTLRSIPEPTSLGLLGLGAFALAGLALRRRQSTAGRHA